MRQKAFTVIVLTMALCSLCQPQRSCAAPPPFKVPADWIAPVLIQVTALDVNGKPIAGAAFVVHDVANHVSQDPDQVGRLSDADGKVQYHVYRSSVYYVQVGAESYFPSEIRKVVRTGDFVPITFHLRRKPLPSYPVTTVRATIQDKNGKPIAGAFFDVSTASGQGLSNLRGLTDLASDPHGHVESTVRTGGVLRVKVQAYGYDAMDKKVRSKPGVVPIVFVLRRNGGPLSVIQEVGYSTTGSRTMAGSSKYESLFSSWVETSSMTAPASERNECRVPGLSVRLWPGLSVTGRPSMVSSTTP